MIRCLIVEDEFAAQQMLVKKIHTHYPEIEIVGIVDNKDDAVDFIDNNELDLVFLDVQIKGGTGLDVLQSCARRDFEPVFVTAYDHYAMDALNENASYYLLKPIRDVEFCKGMSVVLTRIQLQKERDEPSKDSGFILVPHKGMQQAIQTEEIIYLESDGAYTSLVTESGNYISSRNLGFYDKSLNPQQFIRSHHSFIVNISQIQSFKKGRSGLLLMKNGKEIPVAQRRMNDFLDYFAE
jgi:two-component system LytT family response regulator